MDWTLQDVKGNKFSFESTAAASNFLSDEISAWKIIQGKIKSSDGVTLIKSIFVPLNALHEQLRAILVMNEDAQSVEFLAKIKQIKAQQVSALKKSWLSSSDVGVEAWIKCEAISSQAARSFFRAYMGVAIEDPNNPGNLAGTICAGLLDLSRVGVKEAIFSGQERRFSSELSALIESKSNAFGEYRGLLEQQKSAATELSGWIVEDHNRVMGEIDQKFSSILEKLDNDIAERDNKYNALEFTYREKLRYESPARYWAALADKFRRQTTMWLSFLAVASVLGIASFGVAFVAWAIGRSEALNLSTLQGAVIFASMLAAYAYVIRVLSRLAFSSAHLQRDSEEREQLTHLYIALSADGHVSQDERALILQALFSRSETGLLSNEGGPSMPSLSEVFRLRKPE